MCFKIATNSIRGEKRDLVLGKGNISYSVVGIARSQADFEVDFEIDPPMRLTSETTAIVEDIHEGMRSFSIPRREAELMLI